MGGGSDGEASGAESESTSVSRQSSVVTESSVPQSESEVVDLTSDEVVTEAQGDGSSPFSSSNLSLPRKDGQPRRSVSFASDLRVKESLEREMADDDFVLGTGDPLAGPNRTPQRKRTSKKDQPQARSTPTAASGPAAGSSSVVVQSPRSPPVSTSRPTVPISQLLNDVDADLAELEVPVETEQDAGQAEASVGADIDASQPEVSVDVEPNAGQAEVSVDAEQDAGQAEVSATPSNGLAGGPVTEESRDSDVDQDAIVDLEPTASATVTATAPGLATGSSILSVLNLGRSSDTIVPPSQSQQGVASRRPTRVITATVSSRRGTDSTAFAPSVAKVSLALNLRKLPMNAVRFLEPRFIAPGAQKAWCKVQNSCLSDPAPKTYAYPLDFAFLALLYNVENANHPWAAVHKRMPGEPQIFNLGNFVPGTKISICAVGLGVLGGSFECGGNSVGIAVRRMRRLPLAFLFGNGVSGSNGLRWRMLFSHSARPVTPQDPFLFFVLELWSELNRTRNLRADRLRLQIARLWDWCTNDDGPPEHPTEILLELSHQQYSIEVLDWAPQTLGRSRELHVLDAKQPWRNCWVDAPADHPYTTLFAPCNPEIPLFVPTLSWIHRFPEAEIQAPWVRDDSVVDEADPQESAGSGDNPTEASATVTSEESKSEEVCEALNEASFPFSRGSASTTAGSSVVSPSPATDVPVTEDPPEEIVLAPFDLLVQNATESATRF
ncbi:hypothetical protein PHMEG_0006407 [Phytophthora megakarya]|uniref:Uncharacterized protein n=1 Tax=Phytophthora megakarya TaxID=4795 RepID=A0A225WPW2_9STRA|nr:hypothetical protein PHMEG_0006407 [Phytophthora megakarya]